jgi:transcription elongation factor Elf1
MSFLPKIKKCPNCNSLNIIRINGITYKNNFQSLNGWILKKIFNCKKCNVQLGLFLNNSELCEKKLEKLIWMELLSCEESYYTQLNELQIKKEMYKKQSKKFFETNNAIRVIQNKIRSDQVKVKVKVKIKNHVRGMFVSGVY